MGGDGFGREQADLGRGAGLFDDQLQRLRGEVGQVGVVPAFLHAGEGELHAADVRRDLEAVLAQPVAQVAGRAVEQRIAGGQHDDPLAAGGFDLADDRVQVAADFDLFGLAGGRRGQRLLGADQHLGLLDELAGGGGQPFQAVVADADDLDLAGWPRRFLP